MAQVLRDDAVVSGAGCTQACSSCSVPRLVAIPARLHLLDSTAYCSSPQHAARDSLQGAIIFPLSQPDRARSLPRRVAIPGRLHLLDSNTLAAYDPHAAKSTHLLEFSPRDTDRAPPLQPRAQGLLHSVHRKAWLVFCQVVGRPSLNASQRKGEALR